MQRLGNVLEEESYRERVVVEPFWEMNESFESSSWYRIAFGRDSQTGPSVH